MALVTGGARRIGSEVARHLHRLGFDIALHYHRSQQEAQSLCDELLARRPSSCRLYSADLGDPAAAGGLAAQVLAEHPAIALLVNNASGFEPTPIDRCDADQFDRMLGSNLRGPFFLIQGLLPGLVQGASIVNILDVHVRRPLRNYSAYVAAKAGLESLPLSLALELAPRVRVNGIAPGAILWPEGEDAYDAGQRESTVANTPLGRLGEPGDIARTVAFLASDAPFITGEVITVDGGRSLVG